MTKSQKNKETNYPYITHTECEYFPCHEGIGPDNFNCLFCFCPLYALGPNCGGNFYYAENGTKVCSDCAIPHMRNVGNKLVAKHFGELKELASLKESEAVKEEKSNPLEPTDETPRPVVLVVSFGTSYELGRKAAIGAIEQRIAEEYPDAEVRRAFTSPTIIKKLKERDGIYTDHVIEALAKIYNDGVRDLTVLPTYFMDGFEYNRLVDYVSPYTHVFDSVKLGSPLLADERDYDELINAIRFSSEAYLDEHTAICLMGHGTRAQSNVVYTKFQERLNKKGHTDVFVATVGFTPSFEESISAMKEAGYTKVLLRPLLVVAGEHATFDMSDENNPESLVSLCRKANIEPIVLSQGLGELRTVRDLFVEHARNARQL